MFTLKIVSYIFSIVGFAFGMLAAYFWWKASEYSVSPAWKLELPRDVPSKSENYVVHDNIMGWVTGVMGALKKSSDLNRRAAIFTALTVGVSVYQPLVNHCCMMRNERGCLHSWASRQNTSQLY